MIDKLKALEAEALKLEPDEKSRAGMIESIVNYSQKFLGRNDKPGAYEEAGELSRPISEADFEESGVDINEIMNVLPDQLDRDGINPASGFHLGYIPGGGLFASALGDYWADVTNRYTGIYFANPGAVRMENRLIKWMAELVKYPATAHGNLASGGSIANLTAIVTARDARGINSGNVKRSVIYLSEQVHHCVIKAIKIAGLGEAIIRHVDLDDRFRMKTDHLEMLIDEDDQNGNLPFMVIASAGTTDTGAVDPMMKISEIAGKRNLWYHIDGAYGAFFALTAEGRAKLTGMEYSDSLVLDPHKGMFLPYGLGVVLVKNGELMKQSFSQSANYMQDASNNPDEVSPADVSLELTKPFRGLRMWLPLKLHGVAPFRAALEEKLLLAKYFHQKISQVPGFKVGPVPDLSVVIFWYEPKTGDANDFNKRLVREIHEDGRIFLSSTTIGNQFVLRLAILVFRTHLQAIDLALDILKEKVEFIEG